MTTNYIARLHDYLVVRASNCS